MRRPLGRLVGVLVGRFDGVGVIFAVGRHVGTRVSTIGAREGCTNGDGCVVKLGQAVCRTLGAMSPFLLGIYKLSRSNIKEKVINKLNQKYVEIETLSIQSSNSSTRLSSLSQLRMNPP